MMKEKLLTVLGLLSFSTLVFGQHQKTNCTASQAINYLDANEVKAAFRNGGDMFWDGTSAKYQVPYNPGQTTTATNTIFAGGLWLGAIDGGGNVALSGQTYRDNGNDFWPGPLDPSLGTTTAADCSLFDRIWKVEGAAVRSLIADYADNGIINDPIDSSLLAWPGRGNPHSLGVNGFELYSYNQDLAPFVDVNGDAVYNPSDGDYPIADPAHPTVIADQILWSVFNDNGNLHTQTGGMPLKIEVQRTAYAFNCTGDEVINRTIFVRHKLLSRNALALYDFRAGLWTDFDLGCFNDDFIGTVPHLNTVYAYNGDNNDDIACGPSGVTGYGTNPPVQAITLLNQPLHSSMYYASGSSAQGDPNSSMDYHRFLSGVWKDNTPLTQGGDGYDPLSTATTNYVFPDNPNNFNGWSMYSESLVGLDQRVLASTHLDTLMPGQTIDFLAAYSYHRDSDSSNVQNVNLMYQQVPMIQNYYNNGYDNGICNNVFTDIADVQSDQANTPVQVYPNPTTGALTIATDEEEIQSVELYSVLGQLVLQQSAINKTQVALNIGQLPQGVYVLKVRKETTTYSQKVLLNK